MENIIIIIILIIMIAVGIYSATKHFKGKGGCCGGGDYKPKKKKLANIIYQKTFKVENMHCEHCKRRVEEAINDVKGISGKVNLKDGTLTVSYALETDDSIIKAKLEKIGYPINNLL